MNQPHGPGAGGQGIWDPKVGAALILVTLGIGAGWYARRSAPIEETSVTPTRAKTAAAKPKPKAPPAPVRRVPPTSPAPVAPTPPAPVLETPPATPPAAPAKGEAILNVNSIPPSKVIVDGAPKGTTPLVGLRVPAGSHTVVFVHPKLGRQSRSVNVGAGETRTIAVRFSPSAR